jgi:hypothetical protein
MRRPPPGPLIGALAAVALLAIECQTLTGAHERSLVSESGTDGGGPSGGDGGSAGSVGATGGAGATGGVGGVGGAGGVAGSTAGSANAGTGSFEDAGDSGDSSPPADVFVPKCSQSYFDWFRSSFAAVDREVVGSADRPTMPWNTSGALEIVNGRLSGKGIATASQGLAFESDGLRLRYKGRFTDPSQYAGVAVNSQRDGSRGLRVDVMANGNVILIENGVQRGRTTLSPLAIDRDWYLELQVDASRANVRLADVNYPGETGSVPLATIENAPVANSAAGTYLSIALNGPAELPSSIDELFVARCGLAPPEYQWILSDEFERQDSSMLGNAEFPVTAAWSTRSTAVSIARRMLYFFEPDGGEATVPIGAHSMEDGIRLRFAFRTDFDGPEFLVGAIYNFSITPNAPTFTIGSNDGTSTNIVVGYLQRNLPITITPQISYYVQVDLQGEVGVLTLRTVDYAGPIKAIVAGRVLPEHATTVEEVTLIASRDIGIEEVELARYGP